MPIELYTTDLVNWRDGERLRILAVSAPTLLLGVRADGARFLVSTVALAPLGPWRIERSPRATA